MTVKNEWHTLRQTARIVGLVILLAWTSFSAAVRLPNRSS